MELNEYLAESLKDAGFGGVDVQKTPIGTRLTLYVTRPGLVIGRKGTGIKDLTSRLEQNFGLTNPQISVLEVPVPELNPKIMSNRIAQLIERGTAFRRASLWTINTIMNSGALGVEVSVAGKLRSERAHFEKHSAGIIPKSGDVAERVVKIGVSHVLTKMGLMGIQLKIALKNEVPQEFELSDTSNTKQKDIESQEPITADSTLSKQTIDEPTAMASSTQEQEAVVNRGNTNGQG